MFDLGEIVLGILVQRHFSHATERKGLLRECLGQIERIERQVLRLLVRDHLNNGVEEIDRTVRCSSYLHVECPTGILFPGDGIEEISNGVIRLVRRDLFRLFRRQILDSLLGLRERPMTFLTRAEIDYPKMKLHPDEFVAIIDHLEGV